MQLLYEYKNVGFKKRNVWQYYKKYNNILFSRNNHDDDNNYSDVDESCWCIRVI
jgi:hypothetical protein